VDKVEDLTCADAADLERNSYFQPKATKKQIFEEESALKTHLSCNN